MIMNVIFTFGNIVLFLWEMTEQSHAYILPYVLFFR